MIKHLGAALASVGLELIFEDDDVFVLNKPALLHSVELPKFEDDVEEEGSNDSVAARLLSIAPDLARCSESPGDAGLVQRLDFETSGVLMGAKNSSSWSQLRESFRSGQARKSYLVLLEGRMESPRNIEAPIGSPYRRASKVRVYLPGKKIAGRDRAQDAATAFIPISWAPQGEWTLARVEASTGRRHQVRAHAGALGYPLVGDALYGSKGSLPSQGEGIPPFILHAAQLELGQRQPGKAVAGQRRKFEAPSPPYLTGLTAK